MSTLVCSACGGAPLLDGRYRLDALLGQGASGVAFAATHVPDGRRVCIKGLAYRGMTSFDAERLFRREASVLRQIHDPQVPAYIDDFALGVGPSFTLYLVQELVVGCDLETERKTSRPTVDQVVAIADELLEIAARLHAMAPPIVHRDIKPRNIIRRAHDGLLVLVDFGSVKAVAQASFDPGISVQGTLGYMAPEQLRGDATPRSDLYAIGMVFIALAAGREPASMFSDDNTEVVWEPHLALDARLRSWLRRMTAADPAGRFCDAGDARRALAAAKSTEPPPIPRPPRDLAPRPTAPTSPRTHAPLVRQAAPDSARGTLASLIVGGLLFIGIVIAVIEHRAAPASSAPTPASSAPTPASVAPACDGPCLPLTTPFKENLRFGMTEAEARAARPDVARAKPVGRTEDFATYLEMSGWLPEDVPETAFRRLCMPSELLSKDATCCLDFLRASVDSTALGRIVCATDAAFDTATLYDLRAKIAQIYDQPLPAREPFGPQDVTWGAGATLAVGFPNASSLRAGIVYECRLKVTQTSAAWNDARRAREAEDRNQRDAARAAEDSARERALEKARAERKKLELPSDPL